MAALAQPLDETQWSNPLFVQQMGIHENSVLHYFAESPFFDQTSNNAVIRNQSAFNQGMAACMGTRETFEGRLKTMAGLEFMISQEPAEKTPGTGTGVWVIRKQTRRKRQGEDDEITVHSTYFVVGSNVYMAPTLADVIGSRMLGILNSLTKTIAMTSSAPTFTPGQGRRYLPNPSTSKIPGADLQHQSQIDSQVTNEDYSLKENTPLENQSSQKLASSVDTTFLTDRLLQESLNITLQYGDEYMDENPITGVPGDFHFTTTGRTEKDKLAAAEATSKAVTPVIVSKPKPTPLKTDLPVAKGKKSPRTPGAAKKRRKSKTPGAGSTANSPTMAHKTL